MQLEKCSLFFFILHWKAGCDALKSFVWPIVEKIVVLFKKRFTYSSNIYWDRGILLLLSEKSSFWRNPSSTYFDFIKSKFHSLDCLCPNTQGSMMLDHTGSSATSHYTVISKQGCSMVQAGTRDTGSSLVLSPTLATGKLLIFSGLLFPINKEQRWILVGLLKL